MSLNWREIEAVLAEIPLGGSFIQKIRQPDFSSLVIDLFHPREHFPLYVSVAQNQNRLHRLTASVKNTVPLQRFAQLLRSRLKGAKIISAGQIGGDRIIKLHLVRAGVESMLWIRLWNNASNIILAEIDGTIIDAFYRRPKRGEVSGGSYLPESAPPRPSSGPPREFTIREFPGEGDLNRRIEEYYFSGQATRTSEAVRDQLVRIGEREEIRLRSALKKARGRLHGGADIEQNGQIGDILMSNLHRIERGTTWIELEDFFRDNQPISIQLDPSLSPEKNAERYYQTARKQKRRQELAEQEVSSLERDLSELMANLEAAEATEDGDALKKILTSIVPGPKTDRSSRDASTPGLRFKSGPFTLLLGRTSKENDLLLRHHVRGNDYWLHARDFPGAYVFIKSIKGKSIPLDVLLDAGTLAIHYSKAQKGGQGDLFYTQVKFLRRVKGGKQGLVIPTQEKNLSVRLEAHRLDKLMGKSPSR
jgi:predicted ribosome quality control (RQC) complex YloA/Tae2 family protein